MTNTLLYAPQARLVDVTSGRVIGTSAGNRVSFGSFSNLPNPADTDLISAEVTLLNTGVSTLSVVLNNVRNVRGLPVHPPWKYNDFSPTTVNGADAFGVTFGQLLRLDLRYGAGVWTKMILVRVVDLTFEFIAGGSQMTIKGEDLASRLQVKPREDKRYPSGRSEEDIIIDTVETRARVGVPLFTAMPGRGEGLPSITHQKTQTYLKFLQDIADRMDCEIFIDFRERTIADTATPTPGSPALPRPPSDTLGSTVTDELLFNFSRSRSRDRPDPAHTIELRWGKNLLELKPKITAWRQPTTSTVIGSDPLRPRERVIADVTVEEGIRLLQAELFPSPSYPDMQHVDAITARRDYFRDAGDGEAGNEGDSSTTLDRTRARLKAEAQLLASARQFMTAEGQTIGFPDLRPGIHVHLLGLRPPFDGFFYVTKAKHTLDAKGYVTAFSLRRPGMLPPENYLHESSDERAERQRALGAGAASAAAGGTP